MGARPRCLRMLGAGGAVALAAGSCSTGVTDQPGTQAYLQLPGAQFFAGSMPEGSAAGPAVEQLTLTSDTIWPGLMDDPVGGALAATATSAAIGLRGDVGYWVVPAGVPGVSTPADPSVTATATFSTSLPLGTYTLVVRAVDDAGNFGLPRTETLVAGPSPTDPPPTGALVVALTWDAESSLDLHVVDPDGDEIYWGNPSSRPPFAFDQTDGGSYGYIDDDSNAGCVIDGLRREDAIWPSAPPQGSYTVRVDTASLCGQPIAHWTVRVLLQGAQIAAAAGTAVDADTIGPHGAGAGVLAVQFSVP